VDAVAGDGDAAAPQSESKKLPCPNVEVGAVSCGVVGCMAGGGAGTGAGVMAAAVGRAVGVGVVTKAAGAAATAGDAATAGTWTSFTAAAAASAFLNANSVSSSAANRPVSYAYAPLAASLAAVLH